MTTPHEQDPLLDRVADMWRERDPVPDGMVARMRLLARAEAELVAAEGTIDWDHELMELVARTDELVGARSLGGGEPVYTLHFTQGEVDLLLRVAAGPEAVRIDGWVVPSVPVTVRVLGPDGMDRRPAVEVSEGGRFELTDVPGGLTRVCLVPQESDRIAILTPTFEI